jgi:hypothetical protein
MSTFDKREETFEKKFAHDEELQFKAQARRDKLLAHWAAAKLGKTSEAEKSYVNEVIVADLAQPGDEELFRKIRRDFDSAGVVMSDRQIHEKMDELMSAALHDVRISG